MIYILYVYMDQSNGSWQENQRLVHQVGEFYLSMINELRAAQSHLDSLKLQRGEPTGSQNPEQNTEIDAAIEHLIEDFKMKGNKLVGYSQSLQPLVDYETSHRV